MRLTQRKQLCSAGFVIIIVAVVVLNFSSLIRIRKGKKRDLLGSIISNHRGYGTHFVKVEVGNPPQPLRLAVSLGSDYTSFPCQNCKSCQEPHFQYSAVSVSNCSAAGCFYPYSSCNEARKGEGTCKITVDFLGHSEGVEGTGYKGIEITDNVDIQKSLGDFSPNFICQEENFGLADQLEMSYLGMSTSEKSFVSQLFEANKIGKRMFSLCFRNFDDYQPHGASAGHVTFGHVDRGLLNSPLVYADNYGSPNSIASYAVSIRRVYMARGNAPTILEDFASNAIPALPIGFVGDMRSSNVSSVEVDYSYMNGEAGIIPIQTNQPTTYLHSGIEEAFRSTFKTFMGVDYTTPFFELGEEKVAELPTIFLQIKSHSGGDIFTDNIPGFVGRSRDPVNYLDVVIAIPPKSYIVYTDGKAYPILYFGRYPKLAANVFQSYEVVFGIARERIGFAKREKCPEGVSIVGKSDIKERPSKSIEVGEDHNFATVSQDLNAVIGAANENEGSPSSTEQSAKSLNSQDKDKRVGRNRINGELDDRGASYSAMNSGNDQSAGLSKIRAPGKLYELVDGLPKAETGTSVKQYHVGPGAILRHKTSGEVYYSSWSLIGFILFFSAFLLTTFITHDSKQGPCILDGSCYNDGKSTKKRLRATFSSFISRYINSSFTFDSISLYGSRTSPVNDHRGLKGNDFVNSASSYGSRASPVNDPIGSKGNNFVRPPFYSNKQKSAQLFSTLGTNSSSLWSDTTHSLDPKKEGHKSSSEQFNQSTSSKFSTAENNSLRQSWKPGLSKSARFANTDHHVIINLSDLDTESSRVQTIETACTDVVAGVAGVPSMTLKDKLLADLLLGSPEDF